MPHTGKPSGACQQCKQRHTKCDEAKPACGYCVRAKRVCSGYSQGLDLVLRDQNEVAKAGVGRRQRASGRKSIQNPPGGPGSQPSTVVVVPQSLSESEESHALCFFVSTYVLYDRDTQADRGFVELLPLMFNNMKVRSPLSLCLAAASYVLFRERGLQNPTRKNLASSNYSKGLKATRMALQDPIESVSDETLMAVCLLGLYEASSNAFESRISPARHFIGAAALLNQRKHSSMTNLTKRLLIAVRSCIVFRAVQFSTPVDIASGIWEEIGDLPQNPASSLDLMSVDVANLLSNAAQKTSRIVDMVAKEEELQYMTHDMLAHAYAVDARLATWPDIVPAHWRPNQIFADTIPPEVFNAGVYRDSCDIYPDIMICSTWNDWRVARLKVLHLIAKLRPFMPLMYDKSKDGVTNDIQRLVDGICASIPFCLGSRTEPASIYEPSVIYPGIGGRSTSEEHQKTAGAYGGWYLFSPFKETMNLADYLREGQVEWLQGQLMRLAKIYDIERPTLQD